MLAHRKRPPTRSGGKLKPARGVGVCRPIAALRPLADALASACGPRLTFNSADANENSNIFQSRLSNIFPSPRTPPANPAGR